MQARTNNEELRARVERALDARLDLAAMRGARVVIAVPDLTRPLSHEAALAPLLQRLDGVARQVTVIVALGLHRAMTRGELEELATVCGRHGARLCQHDALAAEALVTLDGDIGLAPGSPLPLPATLNREVVEADRVVCTGLVEPHQYAGFSGGIKTLAIGCAGHETISALHGLTYLRAPGTRLGVVEGNPFRDALERVAAQLTAPIDVLQVVPCDPPQVFFGPAQETFAAAASCAARELFESHPRAYPWVHLVAPPAKASNFYQASRAATYVGLVDRPIVTPGGWILLEAGCPEGMGDGAGERACAEALARGRRALQEELSGDTPRALRGGQQRAYVIANLLSRFELAVIGAPALEVFDALDVPRFDDLAQALGELELEPGAGPTLENVFHAVPRLDVSSSC